MPLTGDHAGLLKLEHAVEGLASPDGSERAALLRPVQNEIRTLLKEQFSKGIGPDGSLLKLTARGRLALISKKLPFAFASRIDQGALRFVGKSTRDMLDAHQQGATFAARSVAANRQYLSFNSKGKLVAGRRVLNKKGEVRRGAYQRFAAAHDIKAHVLPARPIVPEGSLPSRYEDAVARGLITGMEQWADKAQR